MKKLFILVVLFIVIIFILKFSGVLFSWTKWEGGIAGCQYKYVGMKIKDFSFGIKIKTLACA